jgi:hypothetical protein
MNKNGEFKLLWATDVAAIHEAEHIGMQVYESKKACEASDMVECGEEAMPIIVFVPASNMTATEVSTIYSHISMINQFNDMLAKCEEARKSNKHIEPATSSADISFLENLIIGEKQ